MPCASGARAGLKRAKTIRIEQQSRQLQQGAEKIMGAQEVIGKIRDQCDDDPMSTAWTAHEMTAYSGFCQRLSKVLKQESARRTYENVYVQWFIAGLILGNFITNIVEKEIDPWNYHYPKQWVKIELAWNTIFVIELVWNMWGHWYSSLRIPGHFLCSGWNIFDTIVVSVSLPSMSGTELPPGTDNLRIVRAFRVFRLFNRIKSLRKILVSLAKALPGMVNAACVMGLVMCIFAILAVDLFGTFGEDMCEDGEFSTSGTYECFRSIRNSTIRLVTPRGMTYGQEYYSTFLGSLFTSFQVLTGESWSEVVARPLVMSRDSYIVGTIYHVLFILVCGIVLVNVVVAVLLEKMMDSDEAADAGQQKEQTPGEGVGPVEDRGSSTRSSYKLRDAQNDIIALKESIQEIQADMKIMLHHLQTHREPASPRPTPLLPSLT